MDWAYSYNVSVWGTSGNITINGTLTYGNNGTTTALSRRSIDASEQNGINLTTPPYAIHNGASYTPIKDTY